MAYPTDVAQRLADELSSVGSRNGGNVYVGGIEANARGEDYRQITVDINRQDWKRLRSTFVGLGWSGFGDDALIHNLPNGTFLVAVPSF